VTNRVRKEVPSGESWVIASATELGET
jgi:hypothetical protein